MLTDYQYRKKITIDKTKFTDTQTDFPVFVKLDDSNFLFSHALSSGYDIRFTSDDGDTLLSFARERHLIDTPTTYAHWKCNDNEANTTILDSLGNYNATASVNTSNLSVAGRINQAFNLVSNRYFSAGNIANIGTGVLSISLWFKSSGISSEKVLVAKRDWISGTEDGYSIALTSATNLRIHYYTDNDYTLPSITDSNWHHLVVILNYTAHTSVVYLDNVYISTLIHTQDSQSNSNNLYIGRGNAGNYWNEYIDDVRLYTTELLPNEISSLYNLGSGIETEITNIGQAEYFVKIPSISNSVNTDFYMYYGKSDAVDASDSANTFSDVVKYLCNDNTVNTTIDDAENIQDGIASVNTNLMSTIGGKLSRALICNNIYYFTGGTGSPFNFGTNSFTISFWFNSVTIPSEKVVIAKRAQVSGMEDGYSIAFLSNTSVRIHYYTDSDHTLPSFNNRSWNKLDVVFDYTNHRVFVYLNGVVSASSPQNHTQDNQSNSNTLYVGRNSSGSNWYGALDFITFSQNLLSANFISSSYESEKNNILSFGIEELTTLTVDISDSLVLDDSWALQPNPDNQSLSDSLILDDTWDIIRSLEPLDILDILTLNDSWTLQVNPDNQSIDDTLILSDNWQLLTNPEQQLVNDGLILSDNWVTSLLGTFNIPIHLDLRWLATIKTNIQTSFSWLLAKSINTDFRWLGKIKKSISTDFRWLKQSYTTLVPINYSNIQIFINGTDILLGNDVDIETGNIIHTIGQISIASFVLTRRHDDLDRTHLGVASQITNQNPIQIYISGNLEFDGYISTLNANSETETIAVTATMEQPLDNRHTIELPLPSLNEKLHLYHCLVNSIQIDNPKEDTRAVIVGNNGRYWNGSNWIFYIENALTFTTDIDAQNYIDIYIDLSVNKIFESKQPSVTSREKNPQYYKGIKVNLGTEIIQQIDKWKLLEYIVNWTSPPGTPEIDRVVPGKGYYANKIEKGTFIAKPNYTYFWAVMAKNVITGRENVFSEYIGTSLASTTTDLWSLNGVTPMYQKIKDNLETELGYYYVGSAPYKEISTKNGVLFPKEKWQDRNDGLYNVLDVSYNYVDYAKLVANLEYQKLKNVAGNILPITSSNLEITFDAYYYYNIKLLTRINVTNTTISDIYKNLNGFPISVKTININFKTMKISLTTDNKLSQKEIDEIDNQMPDDESSLYVTPEIARLVYRKFDLKTWSHVS